MSHAHPSSYRFTVEHLVDWWQAGVVKSAVPIFRRQTAWFRRINLNLYDGRQVHSIQSLINIRTFKQQLFFFFVDLQSIVKNVLHERMKTSPMLNKFQPICATYKVLVNTNCFLLLLCTHKVSIPTAGYFFKSPRTMLMKTNAKNWSEFSNFSNTKRLLRLWVLLIMPYLSNISGQSRSSLSVCIIVLSSTSSSANIRRCSSIQTLHNLPKTCETEVIDWQLLCPTILQPPHECPTLFNHSKQHRTVSKLFHMLSMGYSYRTTSMVATDRVQSSIIKLIFNGYRSSLSVRRSFNKSVAFAWPPASNTI